jgi:hypothetical protein
VAAELDISIEEAREIVDGGAEEHRDSESRVGGSDDGGGGGGGGDSEGRILNLAESGDDRCGVGGSVVGDSGRVGCVGGSSGGSVSCSEPSGAACYKPTRADSAEVADQLGVSKESARYLIDEGAMAAP